MNSVSFGKIEGRFGTFPTTKYFKWKAYVQDPTRKSRLLKLWRLYIVKRFDLNFNCSFGTNINCGSHFETAPHLPHGPYGIVVGYHVVVGKDCTIYNRVTIGETNETTVIGDHVVFGVGSCIFRSSKIGNNVAVGANAVVLNDVPDYCIAVGVPAINKTRDMKGLEKVAK
jgi:Serine acetyltransferase